VLARRARLPAHCALECYSVLTRLPPPHRVSGALARDFLSLRFTEPLLALDPADHLALIDRLVDGAITGGATYDGLVALRLSSRRAPVEPRSAGRAGLRGARRRLRAHRLTVERASDPSFVPSLLPTPYPRWS